jgi:hypothetical protein
VLVHPDDGEGAEPLLRDVPCQRCGHAAHTVLVCGDGCDCEPQPMPGQPVGHGTARGRAGYG